MELTNEEKRIKIAEKLGWVMDDELEDGALMGVSDRGNWDHDFKCYRTDLWNLVTDGERPIHNPSAPTRFERAFLCATAQQRAEAFGKVMGLWA